MSAHPPMKKGRDAAAMATRELNTLPPLPADNQGPNVSVA